MSKTRLQLAAAVAAMGILAMPAAASAAQGPGAPTTVPGVGAIVAVTYKTAIDDPVTGPAAARGTDLVDRDAQDLDRQVRVREDASQADEVLEHVDHRPPLRAAADGKVGPLEPRPAHDPLVEHDGLDHEDSMVRQEHRQLPAERPERPGLDLDELPAGTDGVDAEPA